MVTQKRKIAALIAVVLAAVAFACAFLIKLTGEVDGAKVFMSGVVFGKTAVEMEIQGLQMSIPADDMTTSTLSRVGYIVMLVGAVGAVVAAFTVKKDKDLALIFVILGLVIVAGAVIAFFVKDGLIAAEVRDTVKEFEEEGITVTQDMKDTIKEALVEDMKDYNVNVFGIIGPIFGVTSGAVLFGSKK